MSSDIKGFIDFFEVLKFWLKRTPKYILWSPRIGISLCDTTYIIYCMKSYLYSVEGKCILPWFNLYENVAMPCQPFPTIFKPDLVIWSQSSTLQCNVSWCHHCTMCTCFMWAHCQQFAMWCQFFYVSLNHNAHWADDDFNLKKSHFWR